MNPLASTAHLEFDKRLSFGIKVSLILHALLICSMIFRAVFLPDQDLGPVDNAIKVDLVALPDKLAPETEISPPMKPEPTPSPGESPPMIVKSEPHQPKNSQTSDQEAINLNKIREKQLDALKKLKEQSALDKIREDLTKDSLKKIMPQSAPPQLKGNILSAGNSLTGVVRLQHDSYVSTLKTNIKQHFFLAGWLRGKKYKAILRIRFDSSGKVLSNTVINSSGNSAFDESALDAVSNTAPFPPPPSKLSDYFEARGFEVEFTDNN